MKVPSVSLILLLTSLLFCDIKIYENKTTKLFHETIQLTNHTGDHHYPAWSPDGSMIAYSISPWATMFVRHILFEDDSVPYFYFQDRIFDKPALSPDRTKIAFCSASRGHVWIYSINDNTEKILTPNQEGAYQPTWSTDGRLIAYLSYPESQSDSLPPFSSQLFTIPVVGGDPIQVTSCDSLRFFSLCWSPDNSQIVASAISQKTYRRGIYIVSIESGDIGYIHTDLEVPDYPIWSPDGQKIAFVCRENDKKYIALLLIDQNKTKRITQHTYWQIHGLDWLYGSSKIVFQAIINYATPKKQTWVVSSDEKYEYMILDDDEVLFPQWFSENEILYCKIGNFFAQLKVVKVEDHLTDFITGQSLNRFDTKPIWHQKTNKILFERDERICITSYPAKIEQVVVQENSYNPSLSPDGDWLLYNDEQDIFLKDMKTGITINLTGEVDDTCSEPIWSPDGKRIAFRSLRGLHIVTTDSTKLIEQNHYSGIYFNICWNPRFDNYIAFSDKRDIRIVSLSGELLNPGIFGASEPCWSPDGTRLAYVRNHQIYIEKIFETMETK